MSVNLECRKHAFCVIFDQALWQQEVPSLESENDAKYKMQNKTKKKKNLKKKKMKKNGK